MRLPQILVLIIGGWWAQSVPHAARRRHGLLLAVLLRLRAQGLLQPRPIHKPANQHGHALPRTAGSGLDLPPKVALYCSYPKFRQVCEFGVHILIIRLEH